MKYYIWDQDNRQEIHIIKVNSSDTITGGWIYRYDTWNFFPDITCEYTKYKRFGYKEITREEAEELMFLGNL